MIEEYEERYDLMKERVAEISKDAGFPSPFNEYFMEVATFIEDAMKLYQQAEDDTLEQRSLGELQELQTRFWGALQPENYKSSFLNPAYAVDKLGKEMGTILSMLYADLLSLVPDGFEKRVDFICIWSELFVQVYGCFVEEMQEQNQPERFSEDSLQWIAKNVTGAIYWFYHDYCEVFTPEPIENMIDTGYDFLYNLVMF